MSKVELESVMRSFNKGYLTSRKMVGLTYDESVMGPEPYKTTKKQDPTRIVSLPEGEFNIYMPQTNSPKSFARTRVNLIHLSSPQLLEGVLYDTLSDLIDTHIILVRTLERIVAPGRYKGFNEEGVLVKPLNRIANVMKLSTELFHSAYEGSIYIWPDILIEIGEDRKFQVLKAVLENGGI